MNPICPHCDSTAFTPHPTGEGGAASQVLKCDGCRDLFHPSDLVGDRREDLKQRRIRMIQKYGIDAINATKP